MRRTILLLATMALTLLVASGVALAVIRIGTDGPDTLRGTKGSDQLLGKGGSDRINGRAGTDSILGGAGDDILTDGPFREGAVDVLRAVTATTSYMPTTIRPLATSSVVALVGTT